MPSSLPELVGRGANNAEGIERQLQRIARTAARTVSWGCLPELVEPTNTPSTVPVRFGGSSGLLLQAARAASHEQGNHKPWQRFTCHAGVFAWTATSVQPISLQRLLEQWLRMPEVDCAGPS